MAKFKVVKRFRSNGEEVVLRYPRMSDSDDLLRNINSLVEEGAFISLEKKQTKSSERKWLLSLLKKIKKGAVVSLVAEVNGRVVGLAQVERKPEDSFSHIGTFGISLIKEARGKGIGERLLRAVVAEARKVLKIKIVTLSAVAKNRLAVNCYRKCGFVKTETIKGGIRHQGRYLDRIRMVKYL